MNQRERHILAIVIAVIFFATVGFALFVADESSELQIELADDAPVSTFDERYDLAYVEDGSARQVLDLYTPKQRSDAAVPLIVWIHGGAWVSGDKAAPPVLEFIGDGAAVAAINYRFATTDAYPAQVEDVYAALAWLAQNVGDYNVDSSRVILIGYSAGAQLALVSALAANNDVFSDSFALQAVVGVAGVYDFTDLVQQARQLDIEQSSLFGSFEDNRIEDILLGCERVACPTRVKTLNPATYADNEDTLAVFLQHGDSDQTVPYLQSVELAAKLEQAGIVTQLKLIEGGDHHTFEMSDELRDFIRLQIGQL